MAKSQMPPVLQDWRDHYERRIRLLREALKYTLEAHDGDDLHDHVVQTLAEDASLREQGPA